MAVFEIIPKIESIINFALNLIIKKWLVLSSRKSYQRESLSNFKE